MSKPITKNGMGWATYEFVGEWVCVSLALYVGMLMGGAVVVALLGLDDLLLGAIIDALHPFSLVISMLIAWAWLLGRVITMGIVDWIVKRSQRLQLALLSRSDSRDVEWKRRWNAILGKKRDHIPARWLKELE